MNESSILTNPLAFIENTFRGYVPDSMLVPYAGLEAVAEKEQILGVPSLEAIIFHNRWRWLLASTTFSEKLPKPASGALGKRYRIWDVLPPKIHQLVMVGLLQEIAWEAIFDSMPHINDFASELGIKAENQVVARYPQIPLSPTIFDPAHFTSRFYADLKGTFIGGRIEADTDTSFVPVPAESVIIGTVENPLLRELVKFLTRLKRQRDAYFREGSEIEVHGRFAGRPHMDYMRYTTLSGRAEMQIELLERLVYLGMAVERIQLIDQESAEWDGFVSTTVVDEDFNILLVGDSDGE